VIDVHLMSPAVTRCRTRGIAGEVDHNRHIGTVAHGGNTRSVSLLDERLETRQDDPEPSVDWSMRSVRAAGSWRRIGIGLAITCRSVHFVAGERILIVEDDARIGSTLLRALENSEYLTRWTRTGAAGMEAVVEARPDLVILDLGLPDVDGLEVCRQMHQLDSSLEIVMLTARDDELDVVIGLDAGAIDYITKPFKLAELLARIRAQLRRIETHTLSRTTFGDITIDLRARRLWIRDVETTLRAKEFDLLARLLADVGLVVTRETLMSDVWDEHWYGSTKTLDFHISALRRKIDQPKVDSRITTVRGVGYRYEVP
jgi:DNA-binding response OmpR family regulator